MTSHRNHCSYGRYARLRPNESSISLRNVQTLWEMCGIGLLHVRACNISERYFSAMATETLRRQICATRYRQCLCGFCAICVITRECDCGAHQNNHRNCAERVARRAMVCYSNQVSERHMLSSVARGKKVSPRSKLWHLYVVQPQESCPGHRAGSRGQSAPTGLAVIAEPPEQDL